MAFSVFALRTSRNILSNKNLSNSYKLRIGGIRCLSESTEKLKDVFETYRVNHYSRETKRKFQCDLINAMNKDAKAEINPSDVKCFLENIGASQELNEEELRAALNEIAGDSNGAGVTSTEKLRFFISS